jgi:phosphate-selective porin OprO/OprP
MESGLSSNFLPSRDQGVQLAGDIFNKTLNYSIGIFNGANDAANGSEDSNTDKEMNARLFASPFVNTTGALQGLSFGLGVSQTDASGAAGSTALSSYKTFGQETFFSYRKDLNANDTVFADGERTRLVPQFSYYNGPFGLTGEYVREKQDITRAVAGTQRTDALEHNGWDLTASYTLTGEKASGKNMKPAKPFDPANGGWGAWELVAGIGQLNIDRNTFRDSTGNFGGSDSFASPTSAASQAQNHTLGVNWYLNNVLRLSLDYSDTAFDGGGGGTAAHPDDLENERVLTGRVQANF